MRKKKRNIKWEKHESWWNNKTLDYAGLISLTLYDIPHQYDMTVNKNHAKETHRF